MRDMRKRIDALEQRTGSKRPARWYRVIVDGQSKAEALAAYEAQHGPVGNGGVIYRMIVSPVAAQMGVTVQ